MRLIITLLLSLLSVMAIAADAGIEKQQIKVIVTADAETAPVNVTLDSDELGFSLTDLADGETRSVVDSNGQTVLVTRDGDNFRIDIDGQKIDLPGLTNIQENGTEHIVINADTDSDVNVRVIKVGKSADIPNPDDIIIFSGKPLDQSVIDGINSVLTSAGNTGQVTFIDGSDSKLHSGAASDGEHHVKILRKTLEVTP